MLNKDWSISPSGLPRGKPGPKPKSAKQGWSSSPANPKISTFFSPKRSAVVLPSEEEEQVDEPSEPIVQKPRGPASRTGSTAASAKSATPTTVETASQSGMHPIFQNYIATAAAAPVPSGPPKVISCQSNSCYEVLIFGATFRFSLRSCTPAKCAKARVQQERRGAGE